MTNESYIDPIHEGVTLGQEVAYWAEALLAELAESPLPGARYAHDVVQRRAVDLIGMVHGAWRVDEVKRGVQDVPRILAEERSTA